MGLKILHSADWHLDSPFSGFSPAQKALLKQELRKIPGKIADICRREGCDLVLLSGDIFDGAYTRESAAEVFHALKRCGVPVIISPGNHDYFAPGSPWAEEAWPENVHIFTGALTSLALPELNCRVYGAGYQGMDCPGLLEGFCATGEERYALMVLHGDATQGKSPYCPVTAAQVRESGLDYLALGHIHRPGQFRAGETLCVWPGPPMGRGFDETGVHGVCIVTLEDSARVDFLPLDTLRFWDLELDTDRETLADVLPGAGSKDFYRVTLRGSGEAAVLNPKFPNLELIDRREAEFDYWEAAGEDTLEGIYFRLLREKLKDAPQSEAACIVRAAELSARLFRGREVVL